MREREREREREKKGGRAGQRERGEEKEIEFTQRDANALPSPPILRDSSRKSSSRITIYA